MKEEQEFDLELKISINSVVLTGCPEDITLGQANSVADEICFLIKNPYPFLKKLRESGN